MLLKRSESGEIVVLYAMESLTERDVNCLDGMSDKFRSAIDTIEQAQISGRCVITGGLTVEGTGSCRANADKDQDKDDCARAVIFGDSLTAKEELFSNEYLACASL